MLMADRSFAGLSGGEIARLEVLEIAIGIMLLREPAVKCSKMLSVLKLHCGIVVPQDLVDQVRLRMVERAWIVPHPSDADRYVPTEHGERLLWAGFCALMGVFDEGRGSIEASFLWKLVTRRSPDDLDG